MKYLNAPSEGKRVIKMWKRADDQLQNLKYRQACYPYTVCFLQVFEVTFFSPISVCPYFSLCCIVLPLLFLPLFFRLEFRIRYINQWISPATRQCYQTSLGSPDIASPALADGSEWTGWTKHSSLVYTLFKSWINQDKLPWMGLTAGSST